MAAPPNPLVLQTAGYPNHRDSNLPTAQFDTVNLIMPPEQLRMSTAPELLNNSPFVQNAVAATDTPVSLPYQPTLTCYRNASLTALFNTSPLLNFLRQVTLAPDPGNLLLSRLNRLAVIERRNDRNLTAAQRLAELRTAMTSFWQAFVGPAAPLNGYNAVAYQPDALVPADATTVGYPEDPGEFIGYLFDRIVNSDLQANQLSADGL